MGIHTATSREIHLKVPAVGEVDDYPVTRIIVLIVFSEILQRSRNLGTASLRKEFFRRSKC